MGLIRAGMNAVSSVVKDQWKEFFECDSLNNNVLVKRGHKVTKGFFSNNKGNDNIISQGSGIVVNEGQCVIIVDNGMISEVSAEPGMFTYDASSEPSVFAGDFGSGLAESLKKISERFAYAGEAGKDQRVYYINTKPILDNKFGTPNPIPFKICDAKINLDLDVQIRCSGTYSFRIIDPVLFYANISGNVVSEFTVDNISSQLKSEFLSALQPALASLSSLGLRPSEVIAHTVELEEALNVALDSKWQSTRGIAVETVSLNSVTLPDEYQEMITTAQKIAMYQNPQYAAAATYEANAQAMKDAAKNANGAVNGFMGVNMVGNGAMGNATQLFQTSQQSTYQSQQSNSWKCNCGMTNNGNFCANCGTPRPSSKWSCSCGMTNTGNFCSNCGSKKPQ